VCINSESNNTPQYRNCMIEGRFVDCKHSFKQQSGEQITADSWLMRDLFDTKVKRSQGKISEPKKLQTLGVKRSDTKRMI
jgi:hypothetical protein